MLTIGIAGLIVILAVVFFIFGPKRLPEIGRNGQTLEAFNRTTSGDMDNKEPENVVKESSQVKEMDSSGD
ncbi:twin-arginine translocase TatA/TatE family subunit [Virgibacillus natechei]|nr:twin-arginine translocase TatA/TatE family subunit [Virgibacillus natechei]